MKNVSLAKYWLGKNKSLPPAGGWPASWRAFAKAEAIVIIAPDPIDSNTLYLPFGNDYDGQVKRMSQLTNLVA